VKDKYRIKIVEHSDHTKFYPQMKWKWLPIFWSCWKSVNQGGGMDELYYSNREDAEKMIRGYKERKAVADKKPVVSYEEIL